MASRQPAPAGEATARVLGGYRRTAADRGRSQAAPLRADGLAAILATAERPRTDGRGVESPTTAHRRGRLDAVIASLLFMGGLRRSEVAAVRWADVTDARDGDGVLLGGDTTEARAFHNDLTLTVNREASASAAVQASRSSRILAAYSRVPKKGSPGRSSTAIEIKYQSTPGLCGSVLSRSAQLAAETRPPSRATLKNYGRRDSEVLGDAADGDGTLAGRFHVRRRHSDEGV